MLAEIRGDTPLADHLDRAVRDRILVEGDERPGTYSFAHGLIRRVLIDELRASTRAAWHQRIATTLERHAAASGAVMTELVLSGEVERSYRLLREVGYTGQFGFHSPTSQYGQLSRRGAYEHLDVASTTKRLTDDIASGRFADEWDAESRAGHPKLTALREQFAGAAVRAFEQAIRKRLGPNASEA